MQDAAVLASHWLPELLPIIGKTAAVYCFILFGLQMIGRRSLRGMGPQELILITLLAKLVGDHVVPEKTGFIGNLTAGLTLFAILTLVDRITPLRHWVEGKPLVIYQNGTIDRSMLKRNLLTEADLLRVARDYGQSDFEDFEKILIEKDGRLTGVLKPAPRAVYEQTPHLKQLR